MSKKGCVSNKCLLTPDNVVHNSVDHLHYKKINTIKFKKDQDSNLIYHHTISINKSAKHIEI